MTPAVDTRTPVRLETEGEVAVVVIDNPPVNASTAAVRSGIVDAIEQAHVDPKISAIVLIGAGRTFISGSDIREFDGPLAEPQMPAVIKAIKDYPKPVVAALHGRALGGGFELALGCDARVAASDALVGLPEVTLGIIPGAGGTQRVPRLAGMLPALDLVATGELIAAERALELGLIDNVASQDLRAEAIAHALRLKGTKRRLADEDVDPFDEAAFEVRAESLIARGKGRSSTGRAIEALKMAASLPFEAALAKEREIFNALRVGPEARALRHLFFAERRAGKLIKGLGGKPRDIRFVGIVGAGTMGQGIATAFAQAGYHVAICDADAERSAVAMDAVRSNIDKALDRGRIDESVARDALQTLQSVSTLEDMSGCDLFVEAVFEDMDVKKSVFRELDRIARPGAILASNTSYLNLDEIAAATSRPGDVVGLHFFSPAHVMRLLEIVRGAATSPDTMATALEIGKRLKKSMVVARVGDGFIGNRVYAAYRREAEFLIEEGAYPDEVDNALEAFGMAMGVFRVSDMSGLDIAWAMRKRQDATRDPADRYVEIADELCELGRFGRKTGAGWYVYSDPKMQGKPDPVVNKLIDDHRARKGIRARKIAPDEIVDRMMSAIRKEANALLAECIAEGPEDVDLAFVRGYGFPEIKGGPLFWLETYAA